MAEKQEMSLFKKHLEETLKSLQYNPEEWDLGQFEAFNKKRKILIWHESRFYGVRFKVGTAKYGEVTFLSTILDLLRVTNWRHRLCWAVDTASDVQRKKAIEATEKVKNTEEKLKSMHSTLEKVK
jgi:hypothetical protein